MINIVENKQKDYIFLCVYKIIGIRNIYKQISTVEMLHKFTYVQTEKCDMLSRVAERHCVGLLRNSILMILSIPN